MEIIIVSASTRAPELTQISKYYLPNSKKRKKERERRKGKGGRGREREMETGMERKKKRKLTTKGSSDLFVFTGEFHQTFTEELVSN